MHSTRSSFQPRSVLVLLALSLPVLASGALAAEPPAAGATGDEAGVWSGWRGPSRDGRATAAPRLAGTARQVWQATVGIGHASPISDGPRVFVHGRRGDDEVVAAYDLVSGESLWEKSLAAPEVKVSFAARKHGKGPKATPLLHGGRLVTFGMTGVLSSFEAETGKLLYRVDLADFEQPTPTYGVASSPVAASCGIVVVAGGETHGAVVCVHADTGTEVWRHDTGASYASPVVAVFGGVEQIVHLADRELLGLEAGTGELLWSYPFEGKGFAQNEATPLVLGSDVLVAGQKRPATRLRIVRSGDVWSAEVVWAADEGSVEMSTPVLTGDLLLLHSDRGKGTLVALDAESGAVVWKGTPRYGEHSALVALGDERVLSLRSDGEVAVFERRGDAFEQVLRTEVASSETWAHPLVVADGILVKDLDQLRLLRFE